MTCKNCAQPITLADGWCWVHNQTGYANCTAPRARHHTGGSVLALIAIGRFPLLSTLAEPEVAA